MSQPRRGNDRPALLRYGLAVGLGVAATAATLAIQDALSRTLYPVFFVAVVVAAWYGGFGPGVVVTALAALASLYYFLPPERSFRLAGPSEVFQLALFAAAALLIVVLTHLARSGQRRAEAARAEAAEAQARLEFLAEASAVLSSSLEYETTLANVARLAVPRVADWCVIDIARGDEPPQRLAVTHVEPAKERWAAELQERYPADHQARQGVPQVLRTGQPELYPEITDDMLAAAATDEEHLRLLRDVGMSSGMIVPLKARGVTLGAITLVAAESGRRFGEHDLAMAEDLARRASMAVDNARLFQRSARAAETLQQSLLPTDLPRIPGVEVGARYRPAGRGQEVGGDFYDLFDTGERGWAVVIGDVCGKGVDAAALTGLARYTIRAAAGQGGLAPSGVLLALNDAILRQRSDAQFCTVAYGHLLRLGSAARLTLSCGGHPPPLVVRDNGEVRAVGPPGTLIGLFPDPQVTDVQVELTQGDTLIFYTDGVTEARGPSGVFGQERLEELAGALVGTSPEELAERIEREVLQHMAGEPRDDIAVLVLKLSSEP